MGRYEQVASGSIAGLVGVLAVGEAWHVLMEERPTAEPSAAVSQRHEGRSPEDAPGRETRGAVILRHATMVSSTSGVSLLTASVAEDCDLRQLVVPIPKGSALHGLGQKFPRAWHPLRRTEETRMTYRTIREVGLRGYAVAAAASGCQTTSTGARLCPRCKSPNWDRPKKRRARAA